MAAATSSSVSRAAASSTSSGDRFISDQDSPSSSLQARKDGGMLFRVRLSHWIVRISTSSRRALMRPCHPPIARPVSGSVTPGLTTTLSPMAQLLLFIVLPMSNVFVPVHHTPRCECCSYSTPSLFCRKLPLVSHPTSCQLECDDFLEIMQRLEHFLQG